MQPQRGERSCSGSITSRQLGKSRSATRGNGRPHRFVNIREHVMVSQPFTNPPRRVLNDPESVVRMEASGALATLGNREAVPYLKAAIKQEQDENLRSVLEANLNKLQQTAITPAGP